MQGRVLVIAGSDSGGGAGIQADLKTVTALGGYASTAITAITVQNTLGVTHSEMLSPELCVAQIEAVLSDIGADVIKIGMLGSAPITRAVARALRDLATLPPVVLDPVMQAKGGHTLLGPEALAPLRDELIPLATVLTPNLPEAQLLLGEAVADVTDEDELWRLGRGLMNLGAKACYLKSGHRLGDELCDLLFEGQAAPLKLPSVRIPTRNTHGTGCTLASALAVSLAQGASLPEAARRAQAYVLQAIGAAWGLGTGHGPLHHGVTCAQFPPASNQPASNQPASNQPASGQLASNQPASGQLASGRPTRSQPDK